MGGNPVNFGARGVRFRIPRQTDGLWKSSVSQRHPGICYVSAPNAEGARVLATGAAAAHWINAAGFAASTSIKITTGEGQEICNPRSALADYIHDTVGIESDRQLWKETHRWETHDGSDDVAKLQAYSRDSGVFSHPMYFSKDQYTGKALLVAPMFLAGAAVEVDFAAKEALYKVPGMPVGTPVYVRPDGVSDAELQARLDAGTWFPIALGDSDLKASIDAVVFVVEEEERLDWLARPVDQLWQEIKEIRKVVPSPVNGTAGEAYEYEIKFSEQHLIGRYTLVARTSASLKNNTPFNFGGIACPDTGVQGLIIKSAGVNFGASMRVPKRSASQLNELAHSIHNAARLPRGSAKQILQICFQADMSDPDHTGGADHIVLEEVTIPLELVSDVFTRESPTVEIRLMLHMHRFLRYREVSMLVSHFCHTLCAMFFHPLFMCREESCHDLYGYK